MLLSDFDAITKMKQLLLVIFICIAALGLGNKSFDFWGSTTSVSKLTTSEIESIRNFRRLIQERVAKRKEPRTTTHVVRRGETLASIWQQYGGTHDTALQADKVLKSKAPAARVLRVGDLLSFSRDDSGSLLGFKRLLPDGRVVSLGNISAANDFSVETEEPKIETVERLVTGSITSSVSQSAISAGLSYAIVDDIVDLFSDRIDFSRDIQPGDTFSVLLTDKRVKGVGAVSSTIDAALIRVGGKYFGSIRHVSKDGKATYFNEKGETSGGSFLRYPVQFTKITSVFNKARFHPILKITRRHPAVDFAAPNGTPVRTVADGIVEKAGWSKTAGNMIQIRHDSKYTTVYRHLSKLQVKTGARVSRGQVIGNVGSTGLSTGPHLCFSVFKNGEYTNPLGKELPQIADPKNKISKEVLEVTFNRLKRHQQEMIVAQSELNSSSLRS